MLTRPCLLCWALCLGLEKPMWWQEKLQCGNLLECPMLACTAHWCVLGER